jgi:hypothetical protein
MSVVLDTMTDILVDRKACPRCWTAEKNSKPGMSIQWYRKVSTLFKQEILTLPSSSCRLIYKTAALKILPVKYISSGLAPLATRAPENMVSRIHSKDGSNTTKPENAEPQVAPSRSPEAFNESEKLEEVKVGTKASEVKKSLESKDVHQTQRQRVRGFPQHDEDLKHFKRVQISDFSDDGSFPRLSVLNRLHESFTRIEDGLMSIRSERPSRLSDDHQECLTKFLSTFTFFQKLIQQISQHPSSSLLPPEEGLVAWTTERSQAWAAWAAWASIGDVTEKIKQFFRDIMVVYNELKMQRHPRFLEKFFQQKADMIHYLIIDLERSKSRLDIL